MKIQGYTGEIQKTARVFSNDPQSNIEILTLKANIRQSIQVSPATLVFQGLEGSVLTRSVEIIGMEEKPLIIKPGSFNLKDKMTYRIEEVQKGKLFKIYFTNLPGASGSFSGLLMVTTNYDDTPEIKISLNGNFQKSTDANEKR